MRHDSVNDTKPDVVETGSGSALAALTRLKGPAGAFGVVGAIILLLICFFGDRKAFFTSYFFAYFFWMGLTLGATTLTYLHHTVRATWSLSFLRVAEASNKNLPWMALLFVPIVWGMATGQIYPWTDMEAVRHSVPMQHRYAIWMNPVGWIVRAIIYFAYWIITTNILNNSARRQDKTLDEGLARWRQSFAPPIGVIHVVLLTFAYTDWLMSLDPAWYSTIYGVIFMISGLLSSLALGILIITSNALRRPYSEIVTNKLTTDLGNMLLGLTMFWAYTNLSQFLIIWSGNLPEEITFYANRFTGSLVFIGAAIVAFQFLAPFLMLLSGRTKRTVGVLRNVALLILFMRAVDMWWQITPFFRTGSGVTPKYLLGYGLDIVAWLAIGGIWLFLFLNNLRHAPLVPVHDNRLVEAKAHAHA